MLVNQMGEWSIRGANDAIDFVNEEKDLQLSFEWVHSQRTF